MKLSTLTLATAALALAGSAAMAQQTTVDRTVSVGPNGEVTHVTRHTVNPDGSTRTVHKTRRVMHTTTTTPVVVHTAPVVVQRKVIYRSPEWHRHHRHVVYVQPTHHRRHDERADYRRDHDRYAFTRHGEVHYSDSVRPRGNNS